MNDHRNRDPKDERINQWLRETAAVPQNRRWDDLVQRLDAVDAQQPWYRRISLWSPVSAGAAASVALALSLSLRPGVSPPPQADPVADMEMLQRLEMLESLDGLMAALPEDPAER